MKNKQLIISSLLILTALIAIIVYQFELIKEKGEQLNSKEYQIRQLQESVEKWKSEYSQAESRLRNCTQNLNITRFNNHQLETQRQRKKTQDFFNWD
jgi:chromosome segregation ATPase